MRRKKKSRQVRLAAKWGGNASDPEEGSDAISYPCLSAGFVSQLTLHTKPVTVRK
jgi:hypothetical protein